MARTSRTCPVCGAEGVRLQQTQDGVQSVCTTCGAAPVLDDSQGLPPLRQREMRAFAELSRRQQSLSD